MGKKANRGHLQTKLELCRRHVRRLHHLQVLAAAPVLPAAAVAAVVLPVVLRDPPLRSETSSLSKLCRFQEFKILKLPFPSQKSLCYKL